jgi:16S rRNA (adenine1518-N6/adenine1519-N6)-dimethyltransferase
MSAFEGLATLKETIARYHLAPKKSLGQNFILNPDILVRIAKQVPNLEERHVIEIGPGPGGLTRALLECGAKKVTAIEMDTRCMGALEEIRACVVDRLVIIEADALQLRLDQIVPDAHVIVANLPYNIGTRLLSEWCAYLDHFDILILMFQKEVADRLRAKPHTKDYGRLTILVQALAEVRVAFDLPPGAFLPPPKVTSSVVTISPYKSLPHAVDLPTLSLLTKHAFGQRRKMLRASLKGFPCNVMPSLEALNIASTVRAEDVSVEDYCRLSMALKDLIS